MSEAVMVYEDDMLLFENKALGEGAQTLNNDQIARKVQSIVTQIEVELPAFQVFKQLVDNHVGS